MRTRKPSAGTIVLAAALACAACQDDLVLNTIPPPEIQIDELQQRPAALVDILWVVDNSRSMIEEQASLANNFSRFINGLTTCPGTNAENDVCDFVTKQCTVSGTPCNPPDYHIGVISMDVLEPTDQGRLRRVGLCVPAVGASPANNKYKYCRADNSHCANDPQNPDPQFDPANTVCDMAQAVPFITPTTPGASNAFSRAVQVGLGGSPLESGIRAAAMAVGRDWNRQANTFNPAPVENQGFLRQDASLFIIFVSDEDDNSFGEIPYYYRAFDSLKLAGNEGLISVSAIVGDPDPDGAGQGVGGCPQNVIPAQRQAQRAGTRYIGLAMYTRGLSSEFRVCDEKRLNCPTGSSCVKPLEGFPAPGQELGLCVPSGACQTDQDCGNFKCGDDGCIVCENTQCVAKQDKFVTLLERNGIFGSLCSPDYGVVLGALGFEAAGLSRKFEISKFPDCSQRVPCPDEANTSPVCVKVNGQVIANDRATGWTWEPTSRSIFFDGEFVPPTDANIEVSYRLSTVDRTVSCDGLN